MDRLPTEYLEQVPTWDFATLWKMFKMLYPPKDVMKKVKEGVKEIFPIEVILYDKYEEFPRYNQIRVLGHGTINYYKFLREIEAREDKMREFILMSYQEDTTTGRVEYGDKD